MQGRWYSPIVALGEDQPGGSGGIRAPLDPTDSEDGGKGEAEGLHTTMDHRLELGCDWPKGLALQQRSTSHPHA